MCFFGYVLVISWSSYDCHYVEMNLATLNFGAISGFKTVVSVSTCVSMVMCCRFLGDHVAVIMLR